MGNPAEETYRHPNQILTKGARLKGAGNLSIPLSITWPTRLRHLLALPPRPLPTGREPRRGKVPRAFQILWGISRNSCFE